VGKSFSRKKKGLSERGEAPLGGIPWMEKFRPKRKDRAKAEKK